MNNENVKGTLDDAAGRVKRQVGEWTGDTEKQVEGAAQQVKGKAEKVVGNVKDAVRDAANGPDRDRTDMDDDSNREDETSVERE